MKRPSLEAGYACGAKTCGEGEYCETRSSGSQCGVTEDAGIGRYPTSSCDQVCIVSDDARTVDRESI
ncbi:MAG TPA: hypothetical protein VGM39_00875 [Kofleriaceae bacterium]|jgi:hypothetical protein